MLEGENGVLTHKSGKTPTISLGYRTGAIGAIDVGDFPEMDFRVILMEFLAKVPDLMEVLQKRPEQLSIMYREFWRRNHKTIQAQSLKKGRNEACPCGSGKKYKKCCMLLSAPGNDLGEIRTRL